MSKINVYVMRGGEQIICRPGDEEAIIIPPGAKVKITSRTPKHGSQFVLKLPIDPKLRKKLRVPIMGFQWPEDDYAVAISPDGSTYYLQ